MHKLIALVLVAAVFAVFYLVHKFGVAQVETDAKDDLATVETDAKADLTKVDTAVKTDVQKVETEIKTKL